MNNNITPVRFGFIKGLLECRNLLPVGLIFYLKFRNLYFKYRLFFDRFRIFYFQLIILFYQIFNAFLAYRLRHLERRFEIVFGHNIYPFWRHNEKAKGRGGFLPRPS